MSCCVAGVSTAWWCTPVFQRGQEVPKTVTEQSSVWWVGAVNSMSDAQWIADKRGLDVNTRGGAESPPRSIKQRIGKPIAEYLLIGDGIGNIEHKALNCQSGSNAQFELPVTALFNL